MEEHTAPCLCSHYDEHRDEVGRESWPWRISKRHDCTVDKRLYRVVILMGNDEVVALNIDSHSQTAEGIGDITEISQRNILYSYALATHCRHTDERPHLDHIGQDIVFHAMDTLHTHYCEQVAANATDARPHLVEHVAKLLDIWFACGIIYSGSTLGKHRCHDDIGSTCHRSLVEQHIAPRELFSIYLIYI